MRLFCFRSSAFVYRSVSCSSWALPFAVTQALDIRLTSSSCEITGSCASRLRPERPEPFCALAPGEVDDPGVCHCGQSGGGPGGGAYWVWYCGLFSPTARAVQ